MVLLAEADRFGQSGKSKCLQELLKEPGTIVVLLKLAKVWQILIYDAKFLSKFLCESVILQQMSQLMLRNEAKMHKLL